MALLTDQERTRIEGSIRDLESRTAGEVVVVVVRRSGEYPVGRGLLAFGIALLAACGLLFGAPTLAVYWAIALEVPVFLGIYALLGFDPLERLLVPRALAEQKVTERAFALFSERGIHRTRDRAGVLILISELEHEVVILGDEAVHERLGPEGWQRYVDGIVAAIRRGKAAEGLVSVLGDLANLLAEIAPPKPGDRNELPDTVVQQP